MMRLIMSSSLYALWRRTLGIQTDDLTPAEREEERARLSNLIRALITGFVITSALATFLITWGLALDVRIPLLDIQLDDYHSAFWPAMFISFGLIVVIVIITGILNRAGHSRIAGQVLAFGANALALMLYILLDISAEGFGLSASATPLMSMTVLLAGILVSARAVILVAAFNSVIMVAVVWAIGADDARVATISVINDWWIVAVVAWVYARTINRAFAQQRDVRRNLESLVQERTAQLQAANIAKSNFLANMSHELRTPLNAILGFTQIMERDRDIPTDAQENLQIINRSGQHLLDLINDVLEISKIEAGQQDVYIRAFRLQPLLQTLEGLYRHRAEGKGLVFIADYADDLPPIVQTDERKLRQIILNLLSNAVKFTRDGHIVLRATYVRRTLIIEVQDTGPGIAPHDHTHIFESFAQSSDNGFHEGTGLGLAISRRFARLLGGDITLSSTPGAGSCFRVALPAPLAEVPIDDATALERRVASLAPDQPAYKILVVDEQRENRLLVRKMLAPLGFEVAEAENGQLALERHAAWPADLILMDIRMPVMDGYEATRRIKASPAPPPIIALTASAFADKRRAMLVAGCDDYLSKPFREQDLLVKLSEHLGARYVYADSPPLNAPPPSLTPDDLHDLPPKWRAALHYAARSANSEHALACIDEVAAAHPALATQLRDLVAVFRFDVLMHLSAEENLAD